MQLKVIPRGEQQRSPADHSERCIVRYEEHNRLQSLNRVN